MPHDSPSPIAVMAQAACFFLETAFVTCFVGPSF